MIGDSKKIKRITRNYAHYRHFKSHVKKPGIKSLVIDDPDTLLEAKRLNAEVYLRKGFIEQGDLNKEGIISLRADPHQAHSRYFAAIGDLDGKNRVLATARQINYKPSAGIDSLPLLSRTRVYPEFLKDIKTEGLENYVEISALVKHSSASIVAPFLVYREMLRYSDRQSHKKWIMALDIAVCKHLESFFGGSIEPIGERTPYPGGDVIPMCLRLDNALDNAREQIGASAMISRPYRKAALEMFTHDPSHEYELEQGNPDGGNK